MERSLVILIITLVLASCGGGGGSGSEANKPNINLSSGSSPQISISSPGTFNVNENTTSIGTVLATAANYSGTLRYSLSGTDASAVSIDSSSGAMTFISGPDFEAKNSYTFKVNVTAGSLITSQDVTVLISNVSEPIIWQKVSPESVGMDSEKLSNAFDLVFVDGSWTQAALVIKDGKLIYERYRGISEGEENTLRNSTSFDSNSNVQDRWGGKDVNSLVTSWSTAKSFTSILIAIAIEQGFITSLDQSASDFINEWANDSRNQITIRNLLDMRSGLEMICANTLEGPLGPCLYDRTDGDILYRDNQLDPCINRQLAATGVTHPWYEGIWQSGNFLYSNCDSMVLGEILFRATGKNIETYADINLFSKIGMNAEWWQDNSTDGNYLSYCCIDTTIRDFAKFGQLLLNNGILDGEQIVPKSYIDEIKNTIERNEASYSDYLYYGLQFWMRQDVSSNEYTCCLTWGFDDQYISIDYTNNMLVLTNSLYHASLYRSGQRKYVVTDLAATSDFVASLPGAFFINSNAGIGIAAFHSCVAQSIINNENNECINSGNSTTTTTTTEVTNLNLRELINWWAREDSNLRPMDYESTALTN